MTKKIFASLGLVALAGAMFVVSPVVNAADGTISADSNSLAFCEGRPDGTYRYRGNSATFDNANIVYVVPKDAPRVGNNCDANLVVQIAGLPVFDDHSTDFRVELNGTVVDVSDIVIDNRAPSFQSTRVCVAPGETATFVLSDPDGDETSTLDIFDEVNDSDVQIDADADPSLNSEVEVDPDDSNFVGIVEFTAEVEDELITNAGSAITITTDANTPAVGQEAFTVTSVTGDTTYELDSADEPVEIRLTAEFSSNCTVASSSSMSSMMSSSMVSSTVSSSSMMSSEMMSSSMKTYTPIISGKGGTVRTGASN